MTITLLAFLSFQREFSFSHEYSFSNKHIKCDKAFGFAFVFRSAMIRGNNLLKNPKLRKVVLASRVERKKWMLLQSQQFVPKRSILRE